ncbi:MAG: S1/P1 nuclease [Verrucomicrobiota bacterium]
MKLKFFLLPALLFIATAAAHAWDAGGHQLIDAIAARKLRPEVVQQIDALLPLLDARFHQGRPYDFVAAGTWMDDMRGLGRDYKWARWHYIDIPCEGDRFVEPPPPHALWALDQATEVLRNKNAEPKARAEALGQIIHLVGDIHQPLHVADRKDRGGNDVPIAPFATSGSGPKNLHAFWDEAWRYDAQKGQITEMQFISTPSLALYKEATACILVPFAWRAWAYETHAIACENGWPQKGVSGDQDAPVQLTPAFVHAAHEIALKRIALAGERLAALLNDLLGEGK